MKYNGKLFTILAAASLALIAAMPARSQSAPKPVFSPDQAASAAALFCRKLGVSVTVTPSTLFPAPPVLPNGQPLHWAPLWHVSFPGQADLQVVDGSGVIADFTNTGLERQLGLADQPAGEAISRTDAISRATAAIEAAGPNELSFESANLIQGHNPPLAASHQWILGWRREIAGIPFRDQYATVILKAETGELLRLGLMFPSPRPSIVQFTVSRPQAISVAQQQLIAAGIGDAALVSAFREVVQPNSYWRDGNPNPRSNDPELVWDCRFSSATGQNQVWVSGTTRAVVGGETIGVKRARLPGRKSKTLAQIIKNARQAQFLVFEHGGNGHWRPVMTLSPHSHAKQFEWLKASRRFVDTAPEPLASYEVRLQERDGSSENLEYGAEQGQLFQDRNGAAFVPEQLRAFFAGLAQRRDSGK